MRFKDQVIWITGASSGIGEALAYAFSREGATLVLSGRRAAELQRVAQHCAKPEHCIVLPLDLTQFDTLAEKTQTVLAQCGRIDVLVNNGGIGQRALAKETSLAVDQAVMNTNFFGTVALTKAVLPSMLARKSGHLVVISSVAGYVGTPLRTAYAASKHALQGFFDALRAEVWEKGIKVTLVCPGYIKTDISLHALRADGNQHGKMEQGQARGMPADKCAAKIVKAVAQGKAEFYVGGWEVLGIYVKRFLPSLLRRVVRELKNG